MTTDFFFEIPSFEELQDSNCSPRREEVGRPTLRASGGFLTAFFYRAKFWVVHAEDSTVYRQASTTITQKPLNTLRVEESNSPRRGLHV